MMERYENPAQRHPEIRQEIARVSQVYRSLSGGSEIP